MYKGNTQYLILFKNRKVNTAIIQFNPLYWNNIGPLMENYSHTFYEMWQEGIEREQEKPTKTIKKDWRNKTEEII